MEEITKPVVLFLCTQNSARSQMAEAYMRHLADDRFTACSAGLEPAEIHPLSRVVMSEVGLPLEGHRSKSSKEFLGKVAVRHAIIVCANAEASCPKLWPFCGDVHLWPFDDPASAPGDDDDKLVVFRRVRDEIRARIESWIDETAEMASDR